MGDMAMWALMAAAVLVLVVGVIVGMVVYRTRGPSPAQRVSLHPIQLGVPFRFVLSPKTTARHALWLEGEYHFEGSEMDEVRLDFEVSYDGEPPQRFRVSNEVGTGNIVSQHNRAVVTGTTRLQFLRPRPAGATIAIEGVLTGSPNIDKANLSLLFAST